MSRTSDKAPRILEFINQFVQENGYAPSVREIGEAVDLHSTASVSYHIKALKKQGLLSTPAGKGAKRCLVTSVRPGQIPVVVKFTPGTSLLDAENQDGTMSWDGEPGCFAMCMADDSMSAAAIAQGDKLVIRPQASAEDGQIVAARVEDKAVVRRLSIDGDKTLLVGNEGVEPIDGDDAEILGLVLAVVRLY